MLKSTYDVIVIGSGPSGCAAAYNLAEKGIRTLILEKATLPRKKLCAGGITRRGMKLIPKSLNHVIERKYLDVDLFIHDIKKKYTSQSQSPIISIVSRDRFDHAFALEASKKGAVIADKINVKQLDTTKSKIEVITEKGTYKGDYIILADGANSNLAKNLEWQDKRKLVPAMEIEINPDSNFHLYERLRFDFSFTSGGYAWVFPKKNKISIGMLGSNGSSLRVELKKYINFLGLETYNSPIPIKGHPIPMRARKKPFYRSRVLLVGDSAGFVDPLTGEGISFALKSGILAANSITNGFAYPNLVNNYYENYLSNEIIRELRVGEIFSYLMYGPEWLRSRLFNIYGPSLCLLMEKVISGDKTYYELATNFNNYLKLISLYNFNLSPR
tara:strand:- start:48 stop:1205 length:1158 start_codon:yes stop_codon:yes gene_type:complete